MKGLMQKLVQAFARLVRRFQANQPAGPYEGIVFNAFRSMLTVAFFPPGLVVRNAAE